MKRLPTIDLRYVYYLTSSAVLTVLTLIQTINQVTFSHDFSSYVAPINQLFSTGRGPYAEFWDIKPVYLFMILSAFFSLLGISLISAYIIYGFFLFVFFLCIHSWSKFLLPKIKSPVVSLILIIGFVLSDWFHGMFFPSEIVGLTLVMISILLIRGSVTHPRIILGMILATIAGQTKEVYIFCTVALAFYLVINKISKIRIFLSYLVSNIIVALGGILFLESTGALSTYFEMSSLKSSMFQLDIVDSFIEFPLHSIAIYFRNYTLLGLLTPILFGLSLIYIHFNKLHKFQSRRLGRLQIPWNSDFQILLMVLGAILLGMIWQGKYPSGHYAISLLPFTLLATLFILCHQNLNSFLLVILALFLVTPSIQTVETASKLVFDNSNNLQKLFKEISSTEDAEKFRVPVSRCLQVAYGWESGAYYYYSKALPCSRYFLSPLIADNLKLSLKFREEIVNNAPSEIIYVQEGAGLDIVEFENSVFPYARVLQNCYTISSSKNLFVSRFQGSTETSNCIKSVL